MGDDLSDEMRTAIGDAIETVVRDSEGGFVTRWFAAIEIVDHESTRVMWLLTPAGSMAWDGIGLAGFALAHELGKIVRDGLDDDD